MLIFVSTADLPPLIRSLLRPGAYPHVTGRVQLIQTHISYVLLAGEYVYKIKKPVDFSFLDFSTLAKRRYYCRQEVILNSRLCSDTYLGIVSIRRVGDDYWIDASSSARPEALRGRAGKSSGRGGHVVEYAVKMRRLPAGQMMDRLLERNEVTVDMVHRIADKLANFHAKAETSPRIAKFGDWAIRYNWREDISQWTSYIGRVITPEQDRILRAYGESFLGRSADVLRRRVDQLRIRRVHADLRSDAVCFVDGICIFDCVEFSRRINLLDVARDVGFLAMDLDYRERSDLARAFVERYVEVSGDADLSHIVDFYAAYSACVRGKVEAFLLDEPEVPAAEKRRAARRAQRYFALACRYAESLPPAMLIITCGLSATGKSTLARALGQAAGIEVVSSDVVRKELAGLAPSERRREEFGGGIYSVEFTDRTYDALLNQARRALEDGRSVLLDASFLRRTYRRQARRLARETGAQFVCLELRAGERTVRRWLVRRARNASDPSDARWETYVAQKRRFQRPSEVPEERLIVVDAERPVRSQVRLVLQELRRLSPLSLRAGTVGT